MTPDEIGRVFLVLTFVAVAFIGWAWVVLKYHKGPKTPPDCF